MSTSHASRRSEHSRSRSKVDVLLSSDKHLMPSHWLKNGQMNATDDESMEQRGLLELTVMSLGATTTIVGVCMVMRHDGTDLAGWWRFVAHGALAPCPLCPMLGECLPSINVTEPYVNLTAAAADICDICETIGVDAAALILENDCL